MVSITVILSLVGQSTTQPDEGTAAMSAPRLQSILTRFGSKEAAGRLSGLFQSAFSLILILALIGAGMILEKLGPRAVFYNGAWLMGLATFLALVLAHIDPPNVNGESNKKETESNLRGFLK